MELKDCRYLFLDRDGVINVRKMGGYILSYDEFRFIDGVKEALGLLTKHFSRIFIVTNQQGIGKGLMTAEDFLMLNNSMIKEIISAGGRIDRVYFCPHLKSDSSPYRKPEIGMALQAQEDYPEVDFSESIMVGDSMSDMFFGHKAAMHNVFIDNKTESDVDDSYFEKSFPTLLEFAKYITE